MCLVHLIFFKKNSKDAKREYIFLAFFLQTTDYIDIFLKISVSSFVSSSQCLFTKLSIQTFSWIKNRWLTGSKLKTIHKDTKTYNIEV